MSFKNLIRAAGEDFVGIVTGFPMVSTVSALTTSIGAYVIPKFRFLVPSSYLDWQLKDWRSIYSKETPLKTTYRGDSWALPQVLSFDNTSQQYSLTQIYIILNETPFIIPLDIKARTEDAFQAYMRLLKLRGKFYSNETNVRLLKIDLHPDSVDLIVQSVQYEDYVRTNLCLDSKFRDRRLTIRNQIHRNGELESLETSPLANNFGINALIFTADGQLIVQRRSNTVIIRPGEYCPSASGTISFSDVSSGRLSIDKLPTLREAYDELGISPTDVVPQSLRFLGVTRELIRGGEPEMFLSCKTALSGADLSKKHEYAREKFESKDLHFFDFGDLAFVKLDDESRLDRFRILFDECIDRFGHRMSVPLWTNLALWKQSRTSNVRY
jgi:hypothetical protein